MIAEIHVAPTPAGTAQNEYANIEKAISVIELSGLSYEVSALGTTFEGPADQVWDVLRRVHQATIEAGASRNISNIRVFSSQGKTSMKNLTSKFRSV